MRKHYKLKNKKRFTLFLSLTLVVLFFSIGTFLNQYTSNSMTPVTYSQVTVEAGDTLWTIASDLKAENIDTRNLIDEIIKTNELKSSQIKPGQVLLVPEI